MEGFISILLTIVCALIRVVVLFILFLLFTIYHLGSMPFKIGHFKSSRKI